MRSRRCCTGGADTCVGPSDQLSDTLVALDGKALRGSTPHCPDEQKAQLVGAVSLPSGRSLGVALVEEKSNEIPAARGRASLPAGPVAAGSPFRRAPDHAAAPRCRRFFPLGP
jgi:hypothetical protein